MKKKIFLLSTLLIIIAILSVAMPQKVNAATEGTQSIILNNISIKKGKMFKSSDKIYLNMDISGEQPQLVTAALKNKQTGKNILLPIKEVGSNAYIDLNSAKGQGGIEEGEYYISDIWFNPSSTNYIRYSKDEGGTTNNCYTLNYNVEFTVKNPYIILNSISIKSEKNFKSGDKIYLNMDISGEQPQLVTATLKNKQTEKNVLLPIKEVGSNAYIDLNSAKGQGGIEEGEYYISDIWFNPDSTNYIRYSKDETDANNTYVLNDDIKFSVKDKASILIENIEIKGNKILSSSDKIYLDMDISGEQPQLVTAALKNKQTGKNILLPIKEVGSNAYIDLNSAKGQGGIEEGEYYISDIWFNPDSTNYIRYSKDETVTNNTYLLNYDIEFTIKNSEEKKEIEENIENETIRKIEKNLENVSYTSWNDAYKDYLAKYEVSSQYAIVDIDKNNIPELIIKTVFNDESGMSIDKYYYFTFKNNNILYLGTFDWGNPEHYVLYKMNNEKYLLRTFGYMGYEYVYKIEIDNDQIKETEISNREIREGEPYKKGDEELTFVNSNDYSLINNFKLSNEVPSVEYSTTDAKKADTVAAKDMLQEAGEDNIKVIRIIVIVVTVIGVVFLIGLLILLRDKKKKLNKTK